MLLSLLVSFAFAQDSVRSETLSEPSACEIQLAELMAHSEAHNEGGEEHAWPEGSSCEYQVQLLQEELAALHGFRTVEDSLEPLDEARTCTRWCDVCDKCIRWDDGGSTIRNGVGGTLIDGVIFEIE